MRCKMGLLHVLTDRFLKQTSARVREGYLHLQEVRTDCEDIHTLHRSYPGKGRSGGRLYTVLG